MRRIVTLLLALPLAAAEPNIEALIENGHWKRAREMAEAAYRVQPNDARTNYLLGRVRHEFRKFDDAVKYGETAVRLDPKSSDFHRQLGETYADQAESVSMLKQFGLARKCRAEFDAALAIAPKDPDNLFDRMLYYLQAPGVVGGDKKKAAEIADELMKIDASRGYLALVRIAQDQKAEAKLEGLYQKAVEANPRSYEARITLGWFYVNPQHANPSALEQQAKAALDLNPDRIGGYRLLAVAMVYQKRFDDAAKVIARAETVIPDDLSPNVFAARAMLRDGVELPRAEACLRHYIEQTKEPEADSPPIAGAHWSLGLVYEKEGRKPDARSELETAVRLRPDFEPAKKDLKRLK